MPWNKVQICDTDNEQNTSNLLLLEHVKIIQIHCKLCIAFIVLIYAPNAVKFNKTEDSDFQNLTTCHVTVPVVFNNPVYVPICVQKTNTNLLKHAYALDSSTNLWHR